MSNTLQSFLSPQLAVLLVIVMAGAVAGTWRLRRRLGSRWRMLAFFALATWVGVVVGVTLLRDGLPRVICLECLTQWSTQRAMGGGIGSETLLNVALFVPLGFLATLLWRRPFVVTGLAILLSLAVELLQALFSAGVSDVLDVLANSFGAFVGSWLAWVLLLARDAVVTGRVDRRAVTTAVAVLLTAVAILWGGSDRLAARRQEDVIRRLEQAFAGTTLVDYERWESLDRLAEEVFSKGSPWAGDAFHDDSVARVIFPASFYLSDRCVLGTWDEVGFSTMAAAGSRCTSASPA